FCHYRQQLFTLLLLLRRPHDKNQIVITFFHDDLFFFDPARLGVASNLFHTRKTKTLFLLFFRLFRFSRLPPVVLGHRRIKSLAQDHLHGVSSFTDHFRGDFQLCLVHRPQHIFFAAAQRIICASTHRTPRDFLRRARAHSV